MYLRPMSSFLLLWRRRNIIKLLIIVIIIIVLWLIYSILWQQKHVSPDVAHAEVDAHSVKWIRLQVDDPQPALSLDVPPLLSSKRLAQYCNNPSKQAVTGQEGEVTTEYQLMAVQVVIRHGDRSQVYHVQGHDKPETPCMVAEGMAEQHPRIKSYVSAMSKLKPQNLDNVNPLLWDLEVYPHQEICDLIDADLTGLGAVQHILLGEFLNERYVKYWQLFEAGFEPSNFFARTTLYPRTYQSAMALLYGFLPAFHSKELNIEQTRHGALCQNKVSVEQCSCPLLNKLYEKTLSIMTSYERQSSNYQSIIAEMKQAFDAPVLPFSWPLTDILNVAVCHGLPLPCNEKAEMCVTLKMIEHLWEHMDQQLWKYSDQERFYKKRATLEAFPLLHEIVNNMQSIRFSESQLKFVLYSGHDTTLMPLLELLGAFDGRWPPYASRIVFELYVRKGYPQFFVRVLYNGQPITDRISFCKDAVTDQLCDINYFINFVQDEALQKLFQKSSYEEICNTL